MFPAIKANENDRTKYVSELRMKKSVMSEKSECASSVMKSVFLGIKTPFSEKASGEGPYSRRLYGPPPPRLSTEEIERQRRRRRARSHEQLQSEVGHKTRSFLPLDYFLICSLALATWKFFDTYK